MLEDHIDEYEELVRGHILNRIHRPTTLQLQSNYFLITNWLNKNFNDTVSK